MENTEDQGWKPQDYRRGTERAVGAILYVVGGLLALMLLGAIVLYVAYAIALKS
ncbi:hypothetical protein [Streptomyces sp. NPDC023838]|uniref:hypothetical protein n=1 Tax=Streptomyces sp. NPDC023838 TaxID=3154325 RepID=UPI00340D0743